MSGLRNRGAGDGEWGPGKLAKKGDQEKASAFPYFLLMIPAVAAVVALGVFVLLPRLSSSSSGLPDRPRWTRDIPHVFGREELMGYDGRDAGLPILISIEGVVFDVTAGKRVYGPGGSYHFFAGRDATRSFADGCLDEKCHNAQAFSSDLDDDEREALSRWYERYRTAISAKWNDYPFVGYLDTVIQHYHPSHSLLLATPPFRSSHEDI
ncbi:MAG: cytochrome b5-like heme/steroid binding domain-containing protein [archaeon]|nr:cytochrome b5-like heme/steroid binding domain-containing protein [archaeon]